MKPKSTFDIRDACNQKWAESVFRDKKRIENHKKSLLLNQNKYPNDPRYQLTNQALFMRGIDLIEHAVLNRNGIIDFVLNGTQFKRELKGHSDMSINNRLEYFKQSLSIQGWRNGIFASNRFPDAVDILELLYHRSGRGQNQDGFMILHLPFQKSGKFSERKLDNLSRLFDYEIRILEKEIHKNKLRNLPKTENIEIGLRLILDSYFISILSLLFFRIEENPSNNLKTIQRVLEMIHNKPMGGSGWKFIRHAVSLKMESTVYTTHPNSIDSYMNLTNLSHRFDHHSRYLDACITLPGILMHLKSQIGYYDDGMTTIHEINKVDYVLILKEMLSLLVAYAELDEQENHVPEQIKMMNQISEQILMVFLTDEIFLEKNKKNNYLSLIFTELNLDQDKWIKDSVFHFLRLMGDSLAQRIDRFNYSKRLFSPMTHLFTYPYLHIRTLFLTAFHVHYSSDLKSNQTELNRLKTLTYEDFMTGFDKNQEKNNLKNIWFNLAMNANKEFEPGTLINIMNKKTLDSHSVRSVVESLKWFSLSLEKMIPQSTIC